MLGIAACRSQLIEFMGIKRDLREWRALQATLDDAFTNGSWQNSWRIPGYRPYYYRPCHNEYRSVRVVCLHF